MTNDDLTAVIRVCFGLALCLTIALLALIHFGG